MARRPSRDGLHASREVGAVIAPPAARVGSWHTHPLGGAEPSETDRAAWRAGLDNINRDSFQPYYAAVIAAENARHGWDLHAWVAVQRNGKTVIEPATIKED